jgi:hypothetical protein
MSGQLFLDLDGVLADFDKGALDLLGMSAAEFQERHPAREFWSRIRKAGDFYNRLPEMADARILFDAVAHLDPIVLTGLPFGNWAAPQKVAWVERHFPGTPIITTMARDKHLHMKGGKDVLVDDRTNHREAWENAGGIFVHHREARESLVQLREIYPSVTLA